VIVPKKNWVHLSVVMQRETENQSSSVALEFSKYSCPSNLAAGEKIIFVIRRSHKKCGRKHK
jgi:hypothetical protein